MEVKKVLVFFMFIGNYKSTATNKLVVFSVSKFKFSHLMSIKYADLEKKKKKKVFDALDLPVTLYLYYVLT